MGIAFIVKLIGVILMFISAFWNPPKVNFLALGLALFFAPDVV